MGKSQLIYYLKQEVKHKYLMELRIHRVEDKRYSDGVKYSLLLIEMKTGNKVLMDNHHPKGHQFHLDNDEFPYRYENESRLIDDFKNLILQHFGEKI
jgi:hypothetical protein